MPFRWKGLLCWWFTLVDGIGRPCETHSSRDITAVASFNAANQPHQAVKRSTSSASDDRPHKRNRHQFAHQSTPAEAAAMVLSAACQLSSLPAVPPMTCDAPKQPSAALEFGQGNQPTRDNSQTKTEPAQGLGGFAGHIDDVTRQALCEVGYGSPQGQLLRPPSRGGVSASSLARQQTRLRAPSWGQAVVDRAFSSTPPLRVLTPSTPESIPPLVHLPALNTHLIAAQARCHAQQQQPPHRSAAFGALEMKPLLSMQLDGAAARAAADTAPQNHAWQCHLQHDSSQVPSLVVELPAVTHPAIHSGPLARSSDRADCRPDSSFACSEEASWQQTALERVLQPSRGAASAEPSHVLQFLQLQTTSGQKCFTGP